MDPAVAAAYVEAVQSLRFRMLAKHDGGVLFVLTGTGFKIGRALEGVIRYSLRMSPQLNREARSMASPLRAT